MTKNRRLSLVNLIILLTMLGGLLLGACGQADIGLDVNLDGGEGGNQALANPAFFAIVIIAILAVVALAALRA